MIFSRKPEVLLKYPILKQPEKCETGGLTGEYFGVLHYILNTFYSEIAQQYLSYAGGTVGLPVAATVQPRLEGLGSFRPRDLSFCKRLTQNHKGLDEGI